MFIDCTAPFRSMFNLMALEQFGRFEDGLGRLADLLPDGYAQGEALKTATARMRGCFQRFEDESQDDVPAVLLSLVVIDDLLAEAGAALPPGVIISRAVAELFDNTVGLLRFRIEGPGVAGLVASGAYSQFTHGVAKALARVANRRTDALIATVLERQDATPKRDHVLLRPGRFDVFGDLNSLVDSTGQTLWPEQASMVLWTNRTVVVDGEAALAGIGQAGSLVRLPSPLNGIDVRLKFGVGTVFVVAPEQDYDASGYALVMGWMQYVSAQLDLLRREFFLTHQGLTRARQGKALAVRLNAIKTYSTFIVENYVDLTLGLQHERRSLLDIIARCYEIDRLIEVSNQRVRMVIDRVSDIRAESSARARSLIEKAAFVLASLTVLDFMVNLLWFSKGDFALSSEWPHWSSTPLTALAGFSSDAALLGTLLVLGTLLFVRLRSRE